MSGGDSIHTRGRSPTKKALLIGIGYSDAVDEQGQKLEPIPTSVPNVKALRTFLEGERPLLSPILPRLRNTFMSPRVL